MQAVLTGVWRQVLFFFIERKTRVPDAVAVTSDGGAEVWLRFQILFKVVKTSDNILGPAILVQNPEFGQSRAVIDDTGDHAVFVLQRVTLDNGPAGHLPKFFLLDI